MTIKVLILDDEYDRAVGWQAILSGYIDGDVTVFAREQVSQFISELHAARLKSRGGDYSEVSMISEFDLLIIDYDLLGLETENAAAWSTGAEVAYAARLMCPIGPIVVVNQFGTSAFDLTMKRTIASYADLDVGSTQITARGLWSTKGFTNFRPWSWPNLNVEASRFKSMYELVQANLNESVINFLAFDLEDFEAPNFLSHEMAGLLGIKQGSEISFRDLAKKVSGVSVYNILEKDQKIVESMPDEQLARLATCIVWRWLEKVVLPSQLVVIDLPHLVSRFPWILSNSSDVGAWAELSTLETPAGLVDGLAECLYDHQGLFSRPVYWLEKVRRKFPMPDDFDISKVPDLVFCEDSSKFVARNDAVSFPSDLAGFDNERWVENDLECEGKDVNYEPQSYLLM